MKKLVLLSLVGMIVSFPIEAAAGFQYWNANRKLNSQIKEVQKEKQELQAKIEQEGPIQKPTGYERHPTYNESRLARLEGFEQEIHELKSNIDSLRTALAQKRVKLARLKRMKKKEDDAAFVNWLANSSFSYGKENFDREITAYERQIKDTHNQKAELYNRNVPQLISKIIADRLQKPVLNRTGTVIHFEQGFPSTSEDSSSSGSSSESLGVLSPSHAGSAR